MGAEQGRLRAVLDTNVVLSALLFRVGRLAWLRTAWQTRRFEPLADGETVRELVRVLAYPKFQLDQEEIEIMLSGYLPYVELIGQTRTRHSRKRLLSCRDRHDQMFVDLATNGKADVLVTGDRDLLVLAAQAPFDIESPADFRRRLEDELQT